VAEVTAPLGAMLLPGGAWVADPTAPDAARRLPIVAEARADEKVCLASMPEWLFACTLGGEHDFHCATIAGGRVIAAWPRTDEASRG